MPSLPVSSETEVRAEELRQFARSATAVEILCLALVGLVLSWSRIGALQSQPLLILMAGFAVAIALFCAPRLFPRQTQSKLTIESWTMMLFVTGAVWFTGKNSSPLLNLYLLPIILSALTLGRMLTLIQVGAICVLHFWFASSIAEFDAFSFQYGSHAIGELTPFLLVAYLTTTLKADVSAAREHLQNLAQTDALTGVLNVRAFNEIWQRQHARIDLDQGVYALLVIGIDKLKSINETFGHAAGDSAIVLVAQCIQRCIRASDYASRLGGDEFAVLLPMATPEIADSVEKRIRNNVYNTTLDVRSRMIRCSVSIGVVSFSKDARDARELMSLADRRMHRDKELRRPPNSAG